MKADASKELIEVDALRVGMFVHLDMSWMSHPFPLGTFKIATDEQLATIRSLGTQHVHWSPTQSDALPPVEPAGWTGPSPLDEAAPPRNELMTTHPSASVSESCHSKTISGRLFSNFVSRSSIG